jgi:hypothetical protein
MRMLFARIDPSCSACAGWPRPTGRLAYYRRKVPHLASSPLYEPPCRLVLRHPTTTL